MSWRFPVPRCPPSSRISGCTSSGITLGASPSGYALKPDGRPVADNLRGGDFDLDLSKTPAGKHTVQLTAKGVSTYFDLSPARLATKSSTPLPAESTIEFTYAPAAHQN